MADYTPIYGKPLTLTLTAGAAITGGTTVKISADNTVIPTATANDTVFGVAGHDAANGAPVSVHTGAGVIHETPSSGAITAGAAVYPTATAGTLGATAGTGPIPGFAVKAAAGNVVRWKASQ